MLGTRKIIILKKFVQWGMRGTKGMKTCLKTKTYFLCCYVFVRHCS